MGGVHPVHTESHKFHRPSFSAPAKQFSFRSVDFAELWRRMEWIATQEGIEGGFRGC